MKRVELLNKLTSNNIRIQDKADQCEVKKQTFYNYIKYYENGELAKIPEVVRDYFTIVMDEKRGDRAVEDAERFWESRFQYLNASRKELKNLKVQLSEKTLMLKKIESELISNPDSLELKKKRDEIKKECSQISLAIGSTEAGIDSISDELLKKSTPKGPEDPLESQIKEVLLNSPPWAVSADLLASYSVNDNGHFMIIYDHPDKPAKAEIFAAIGGELVMIATYRNKENENFISFNLAQGLDYFYQLTVYCGGGPLESEINKL